jgi:eukaryotic-like serine/threonine-protein kinase
VPESQRSSTELVGRTLAGRYRVLRWLGQGAIGSVYEVAHVELDRHFAAKVLKKEHRDSEAALARFRREAKLLAMLSSPHTVEVIDYEVSDGVPFFVMEYLTGETLAALLKREGVLPVRRAVTLLLHACRALRTAHALGILHRDLKPANLFVVPAEEGEVCKVLDFGVAKATEVEPTSSVNAPTTSGAIIGTIQYMPPEQLRGERELDERVDVYALATILYECLSGKRAFDAATPPLLMYKILEESAVPLGDLRPELPRELVRLIERAMAQERTERPATVHDFERELLPFSAVASPAPGSLTHADGEEPAMVAARYRVSERTKPALAYIAGGALAGAIAARLVIGNTTGDHVAASTFDSKSAAGEPSSRVPSPKPLAVPATLRAFSVAATAAAGSVAVPLARPLPVRPSSLKAQEAPARATHPLTSARVKPDASSAESGFDRRNPYLPHP